MKKDVSQPAAPTTVEMRERIVAAAILVAAQAGFTKATTKEIAKRAKCSEGIIYHYFKSKRELFLAVIKESGEEFLAQLPLELNALTSAKDKIKKLIDFHFAYFTGRVHIFQILFGKGGEATVPFQNLLKLFILPYVKFIVDVINDGIDSGEFQKVNPGLAATNLLGMMQFNIIKLHFGVSDMAVDEIKDTIKTLILKMFLRSGGK